jgi:hypothetical protein
MEVRPVHNWITLAVTVSASNHYVVLLVYHIHPVHLNPTFVHIVTISQRIAFIFFDMSAPAPVPSAAQSQQMQCTGCLKHFDGKAYACSSCTFLFCSFKCYKSKNVVKQHIPHCKNESFASDWHQWNHPLLELWGRYVISLETPDRVSYVGMSLNVDVSPPQVTYLDEAALQKENAKLHGDTIIRKTGYTYCFAFLITVGGIMRAFEMDVVVDYGCVVPSSGCEWLERAAEFLVTPAEYKANVELDRGLNRSVMTQYRNRKIKESQLPAGFISTLSKLTAAGVDHSSIRTVAFKLPFRDFFDWKQMLEMGVLNKDGSLCAALPTGA